MIASWSASLHRVAAHESAHVIAAAALGGMTTCVYANPASGATDARADGRWRQLVVLAAGEVGEELFEQHADEGLVSMMLSAMTRTPEPRDDEHAPIPNVLSAAAMCSVEVQREMVAAGQLLTDWHQGAAIVAGRKHGIGRWWGRAKETARLLIADHWATFVLTMALLVERRYLNQSLTELLTADLHSPGGGVATHAPSPLFLPGVSNDEL